MRKVIALLSSLLLFLFACDKTTKEEDIHVSSVSVTPSSSALTIGETVQLQATVSPENATNKTVVWSSSSPEVATVSNSGLVTAKAEGTTIIEAKANGKTGTCTITVKKGYVVVSSVELNYVYLELIEGDSETITVTVKPDDATDKTVTWSTSDASVATVEGGKVTAIREGTATITAKAGEKSAECKVTVAKKVIDVASVELNKTSIELIEGDSETLTATVKPDDATDKTVTWSTSDASVATVEGGKVTAIKEGTATVTAKAGDKSAECQVTVTKKVIFVTSVELNKTAIELIEGDSETLTATVKPDDATDKTVTWSTSNASVATVESGKVTAIEEGTATITAKAGDKSAECKVTVSKKVIAVTSVELNKSSLELIEGDSETITATVKPDDATDKTVTWSTSDASVATVEGGKVTAIKEGTANITAKAGEKSAECKITVSKKVIAVTSVELNKTFLELVEGGSETLTASVKPDDATDKTVTWSTSDASVATVEGGKITAIKKGTATITAKAGDKSAECKVTVKLIEVESISLNKASVTLSVGEVIDLIATILPENATNKKVIWSSDNTSVASVSDGKVTAVAAGSATITVQSNNGLSAKCGIAVISGSVPPGGSEGTGDINW